MRTLRGYRESSGEYVPLPDLLSAPCHTKIVCTLGPSTSSKETLEAMIAAGMDVACLDFSQRKRSHKVVLDRIRELSEKWNNQIAVIADIKGARIRTGRMESHRGFKIEVGDQIRLTSSQVVGTERRIQICHDDLINALNTDDVIFINNGLIKLVVVEKDHDANDLVCECQSPGNISSNQCCNTPSGKLSVTALSTKDLEDLEFIAKLNPEYVTAPYVAVAADVEKVRDCLRQYGNSDIKIIAKIERPVALENLDAIIKVSDALMFSRGGLNEESEAWGVEKWQNLVRRCNREGKPVIVAVSLAFGSLPCFYTSTNPT
jgi:pyruvate kinase